MTQKFLNFGDYAEEFRLKGVAWATANGEAERLEHMRHSILGELFNQMEGGVAEREHKARNHTAYRSHIKEMTEARTKANIARAEMDTMRMRFDGWRTVNATKRAEMKVL